MTDSHPDVAVVYVIRDSGEHLEVLLGRKLTGLGVGKFVGPGGKLEVGESARAAAVREVAEEVGIVVDPQDLREIGIQTYEFPHRREWSQRSTAYFATRWTGQPTASDELEPRWFPIDALPFDQMWDDARLWLTKALAGEHVTGRFVFSDDNSTVSKADFTG